MYSGFAKLCSNQITTLWFSDCDPQVRYSLDKAARLVTVSSFWGRFLSVICQTERDYQILLKARTPDDEWLTAKDLRRLKQPVTRVVPGNIFQSHLSQHTVFEDETDRKLRRKGVFLRPVGLEPGARLTEKQIAVEEERLGIRLPEPWRDVYKHFNGGWTDRLFWGDPGDPRMNDPEAITAAGHEYLALEDVLPLRDLMGREMEGHDWQRLDKRLIAIGCRNCEAMVLDYRDDDDPKVCRAFFSQFSEDPLESWEEDDFTYWWPDMRVFFRGLYLQDRMI